MNTWTRHVVKLILASAIAIGGGAVGAALIISIKPIATVGFGQLLGPALGALLAALLAYQFGVRKYFDEKRREALIDRYVVHGVDALADATAQECEVALLNYGTAHALIELAARRDPIDDKTYDDALARLQRPRTSMSIERFRLGIRFGTEESTKLYEALAKTAGHMLAAQGYFTNVVPVLAGGLRKAQPEKREEFAEHLHARARAHSENVTEIQAILPAVLASIGNVLHERLIDAERLPTDIASDPEVNNVLNESVKALERLNLVEPPPFAPPADSHTAVTATRADGTTESQGDGPKLNS